MDIIDYLKSQQPLDGLIIDMLYFGMSVSAVSRKCDVSRQHVYNVIERSKQLLLKYKVLDNID